MTTQFEDVWHNNSPGKLRIATSGIGWKPLESGDLVTVSVNDIAFAQWTRVARGFQRLLGLKHGGQRKAVDNFKKDDFERLSNRVQNDLSTHLETREITVRGWNWGKFKIAGPDLEFSIGSNPAFYVPLEHVHNTTITKNEVAVEILRPQPDYSGLTEKEVKKKRRTEPEEESSTDDAPSAVPSADKATAIHQNDGSASSEEVEV